MRKQRRKRMKPMGSVAAAVARDERVALTPADKAETPKPAAEATPTPPSSNADSESFSGRYLDL